MKRFLLSIIMVVMGLSAFSQSPTKLISLQPAYPLAVGECTIGNIAISSNGLCLTDTPLDSLPRYEIGLIDTQTVRYSEEGYGFYVKADSLHSANVSYKYEVNNPPPGTFRFNEATGRFKYYPTPDEYQSFIVTFSATNGTESVSEDVVFNPMPKIPSEEDAFNTEGTMPDAGDYTTIAETSKEMYLNNQDRTAYSYSISGKDVIFDDAVQNKLWGLNGREDIYELNLYAERLIIRSAIKFPGTDISIFAKELIFEDKGNAIASINTSPMPIETLANGDGLDGGNAGNISLFVKEFKSNPSLRFILNGAKGQSANRNGTPGKGGDGGVLTSNIDLSGYYDNIRGSGGVKYDVAADGSTTTGPAIGYGTVGGNGRFDMTYDEHAYLHPYYISAVMRHANDAFINNHTEYVLSVCSEYRSLINDYLYPYSGNEGGDVHEGVEEGSDDLFGSPRKELYSEDGIAIDLELHNDLTEISSMLYKIEQGLDYFGNPTGWTPLLSFEVMLANYNNEIDRAIPTLYMYYWLNRIDKTLQHNVEASQFAASATEQEIDANQELLNSLILEIPVLQDEADEVNAQIKSLTKRIKKLQDELMARAVHHIKKQNRLKKIFGIAQTIANVIPIFGPIGAKVGKVATTVISAASSGVSYFTGIDLSSTLNSIGTTTVDQDFFNKLGTFLNDAKTHINNKDFASLSKAYKDMQKTAKPLEENIKKAKNLLSKSSAPNAEVQAYYNQLIANSPEWKKMKKQVSELNTKKDELLNHLNQVFSGMAVTMSDLSNNVLALDAFKREVFEGNSKRDLNAMLYLEDMNQRAKNRLLKYHYYLRKAYEYRILKPYEGEFNLVGLFDRYEKLGQALGDVIDEAAYQSLASVFKDVVSDMTEKIIDEYTKNYPEQTAPITIILSPEQIDAINSGEGLTLNFHDMGVFSPDEENVRIVNLGIQHLGTHVEGNVGYSGRLDLNMTHSGISQFRKDGQLYWFDHMSRNSTSPHTWGVRYDAVTKESTPIQPSAATYSLLSALVENNDIMLFSRPSAWSDIFIEKTVNSTGGADIIVDSLVLRLQYDFTRRPNSIRNIDITANEDLMPYIACSEEDANGHGGGYGPLYRSYKTSSQNITFSAVKKYETYYFVNWTDRSGKVVSDNVNLTVNRSKDQFYIANYERRVPILNVADTIRVKKAGGTYKVNISNIGSGDEEMEWLATDSISTWVHLSGIAEGIDDGSFTISYDTNTTGKVRIDSLEIFTPETDAMSKTIYIIQDNTEDIATDIDIIQESEHGVSIYPIPARDHVNIEGESIVSVSVYSLTGNEVISRAYNGENLVKIGLNGIPHGVYVFTVVTNNGKTSRKVLKL